MRRNIWLIALIALTFSCWSPTVWAQAQPIDDKVEAAFSALEGENEQEALRIIAKVNKDSRNADGQTLLMAACQQKRFMVAEALVDNGADLNAVSNKGFHTMFFLSGTNHASLLEKAVKRRGKLDVRAPDGTTLLHRAAENGLLSSLRYLISQKVDVNALTNEGATPLMFAAYSGKEKVIQELLKAGADTSITVQYDNNTPEGIPETAYKIALRERNDEAAEILRQAMGLPKPYDTVTSLEGDPW